VKKRRRRCRLAGATPWGDGKIFTSEGSPHNRDVTTVTTDYVVTADVTLWPFMCLRGNDVTGVTTKSTPAWCWALKAKIKVQNVKFLADCRVEPVWGALGKVDIGGAREV